ncbi:nitrate ABC transporter substrate-binding protein [Tardiphaga alba]|uniref:Nitrate ABC transporter substrate-binding protein n=1 Tax=Tardiphaga alba TaxID=340268 RepID=A0ABX8AET1_9BRAD|nr:ABC transporter substrate-binding protein [Tardiphaga alba]QUS41782.1 nitrate ABC transporter substrate-binding protein [Tardiphaga alba]
MSRRSLLHGIGAFGVTAFYAPSIVAAQDDKAATTIQFTLDRPVDAIAAPFVLAASRGLYRAQNLNVALQVATGSKDTITRVAAGTTDIAVADFNSLVRYRADPDAAPVKAAFVLLNRAPYAVVARKSRGVISLGSLEGRTLGVADGDLAIRLWPALARRNGIKASAVKQEKISPAVREPMLSAGQVDAVTGFSYLSAVNLRDRGIPADDLAVFRFAEFGSAAYGLAVIVSPKFAAARSDAVKGFVQAITSGTQLAIQDPDKAVDDVLAQMDGGTRELELTRLKIAISDNILTDDVRRDGLGGIDSTRFDASLVEIAEDFTFRNKRPAMADVFDDRFLAESTGRKIN